VSGQSAIELKEGSDIDAGRIRFGSGYEFLVTPGFAPDVYQQLSAMASAGTAGSAGMPYVIIQFNFPVDLVTKSQLEQKGVVFGDPIDKLSFYAKIPPAALPEVNQTIGAGKVNFVGTTPPEARLAGELKAKMLTAPGETLPIIIQLFEAATPEQVRVLSALMNVTDVSGGPMHLVAGNIEAARLLSLAQQPFIQWVAEQPLNELGILKEPVLEAAPLSPANFEGNLGTSADIVKKLGFNGSGINVAVMDSGIARQGSTYHPDLPASRIADEYFWDPESNFESINAADDAGHGTHVAGTIGGGGVTSGDFAWQGQAPGVNFLIYRLSKNNSGFTAPDFQASLGRGAGRAMHISNNSWGGGNGVYNINSQLADRAVRGEFNNQYINMVIISHNDNALTRSPGTAKNALTVGAVKDGNWPSGTVITCNSGPDSNWPPGQRICFSNFGPVDADGDGETRVKPDIMAPGVRIRSPMPWYLSPFSYYDTMDGTSMAAPHASGAVAQFLDAYNNFFDWPELVKAAFIVSATDVGGTNVSRYGRGMLNVFHAIFDQTNISDISFWTNAFNSTGTTSHTFTVPNGFKEVRIALAWADPVSGGGSDTVVNDLDVRVLDGSGTQVGESITPDDTVEYIKVTSGVPGTWRIETRAFSLSSPQSYGLAALVVLKNADLTISGSTDPATGTTNGNFYLYSTIANSGFAAPGSYVRLALPNTGLFALEGARIYTNDGRSHYYDDSELHSEGGGKYWSVATGETISGHPRLVRWFLKYSGAGCVPVPFEIQAYYRKAEATLFEDTKNVIFSPCSPQITNSRLYLPVAIK
jgi:serine protease AprX